MNKLALFTIIAIVAYGIASTAGIISSAPVDALLSVVHSVLVG